MSVTAMTFNEAGEMKNRCAFSERRAEINTGEMGPTSKKDREEIARRAAQATETMAAEEQKPAAAAQEQPTASPEPASEPASAPASEPAQDSDPFM
jgi:hypothetical protein